MKARTKTNWPTGNHVYVVQQGTDGPVKIGTTGDVRARLRALQNGSPHRLRVLAMFPGGVEVERRMHDRFVAFRLSGEWFRPDASMLDAIRAIAGNVATDDHARGIRERSRSEFMEAVVDVFCVDVYDNDFRIWVDITADAGGRASYAGEMALQSAARALKPIGCTALVKSATGKSFIHVAPAHVWSISAPGTWHSDAHLQSRALSLVLDKIEFVFGEWDDISISYRVRRHSKVPNVNVDIMAPRLPAKPNGKTVYVVTSHAGLSTAPSADWKFNAQWPDAAMALDVHNVLHETSWRFGGYVDKDNDLQDALDSEGWMAQDISLRYFIDSMAALGYVVDFVSLPDE